MASPATWPPTSSGTYSTHFQATGSVIQYACTDGVQYAYYGLYDDYQVDLDAQTETIMNTPAFWGSGGSAKQHVGMVYFGGTVYRGATTSVGAVFEVWRWDGGTSWTKVYDQGGTKRIGMLQQDGTYMYAVGGNLAVYSSDGTTWNTATWDSGDPDSTDPNYDYGGPNKPWVWGVYGVDYYDYTGTAPTMSRIGLSGRGIKQGPEVYWGDSGGGWDWSTNLSSWTTPTNALPEPFDVHNWTRSVASNISFSPDRIYFWDTDTNQWSGTYDTFSIVGKTLSQQADYMVLNDGRAFVVAKDGSNKPAFCIRSENFDVAPTTTNHLWVYKTTDGGLNWTSRGVKSG